MFGGPAGSPLLTVRGSNKRQSRGRHTTKAGETFGVVAARRGTGRPCLAGGFLARNGRGAARKGYPCGDEPLETLAAARTWGPRGCAACRVTALALLAVTAAVAVLLAVRSHLAWPPVVVAVLGLPPCRPCTWPGPRCPAGSARRNQVAVTSRPLAAWQAVGCGGAGRASGDRRRPDAGVCPPAAR